jgi:hypothetical protein
MDSVDGTDIMDLAINVAIYDESSPYTPPPRIRTPKEREEPIEKVDEQVSQTRLCISALGILAILSFVFGLPMVFLSQDHAVYLVGLGLLCCFCIVKYQI